MQTSISKHTVNKSQNFDTTTFTFNASAEAFKIISDKLYSKPIEAVIRELSCNAFDAHVKAGKSDVPFAVKLPTHMDSLFCIQDFGTGLTPQEIKDIYTVVFKSDKNHSNDYVGCFGLGSKSPFSIISQFSVESVVDGHKWIYSVFLNENRVPSISDISNGGFATDEVNGIKISFSVDKKDHHEFQESARRVFSYFNPKPIITGANLNINLDYSFFKKDFYGVKKSVRSYDHDGGYHAIMGNVCYKIDDKACNLPRNVSYGSIDLYFNLGELSPTPSRENLQYDEKTKKHIEGKFQLAVEDIISESIKSVKNSTSLWDARVNFAKIYKYYGFFEEFLDKILKDIDWNGTKLLDKVDDGQFWFKRVIYGSLYKNSSIEVKHLVEKELSYGKKSFFFVEKDEKRSIIPKLKQYSEKSNIGYYILPVFDDTEEDKEKKKELYFILKNNFGFPDDYFIKSSSIPNVTKIVTKTRKKKFKILRKTCWCDLDIDKDLVYYYVYSSRNSWGFEKDLIKEQIGSLKSILGIFDNQINIVGITPSTKGAIPSNFRKLKDLSPFFNWLIENQQDKEKLSVIKTLREEQLTNDSTIEIFESMLKYDKKYWKAFKDEETKNFVESLHNVEKLKTNMFFAFELFGVELKPKDLQKEIDVIGNKYPLLRHLRHADRKEICEYINLVYDSKEKK